MRPSASRYVYLLPAFVLIGLAAFYPIVSCIGTSFTSEEGLTLANYGEAIQDGRLRSSMWNTCIFTFFSLALEVLLGLFLALCLAVAFRGRGAVRAIVLIPWALPPAVMAMGWRWIYNDVYGAASDILFRTGLTGSRLAWLGSPALAMFSLVVADVWKTTPFVAVILLAGLQSIPRSLYEAAAIDGAGRVRQFFMITLPLLRPYILLAVLFRGIQAFGVFDLIWVLTRGGPGGSTETVSLHIYSVNFRYTNPHYAAALTVIVFVVLLGAAIAISVANRKQYELA
jgi:multiple sugar transport system permease protein